jgi:hypothetical protein
MPIDSATGVAVAKTGLEVGKGAIEGWGWLKKWIWGTVEITKPDHMSLWCQEHLPVEGTHKRLS